MFTISSWIDLVKTEPDFLHLSSETESKAQSVVLLLIRRLRSDYVHPNQIKLFKLYTIPGFQTSMVNSRDLNRLLLFCLFLFALPKQLTLLSFKSYKTILDADIWSPNGKLSTHDFRIIVMRPSTDPEKYEEDLKKKNSKIGR